MVIVGVDEQGENMLASPAGDSSNDLMSMTMDEIQALDEGRQARRIRRRGIE